jgi:hypothetical protein
MSKERVSVGVANEGEINLLVEQVKEWVPKNISYIGSTVFFKQGDTYFSMNVVDFKNIFNK